MRLRNLTGHPVRVDGAAPGAAPLVLPTATGPLARVADPLAGQALLRVDGVLVRETRLWRSEAVTGLPDPEPGVRYVVSRLTALAAHDRDDLLFPHEEHRTAGVVDGAGALGRFMPSLVPLRQAQPPPRTLQLLVRAFGHGLRDADWSDVPRITRWTGVTFAVATAFLGAALGTAPTVVGGDPRGNGFLPTLLSGLLLLGFGCWALVTGVQLWKLRERALTERGTVYVVEEIAEAWTYEEKRRFLGQLTAHFPSVLRVPGPGELGQKWHWPLDDGARHWSRRVDALVRSFWAVHYNDDPTTDNCILVWAWWPVAIAFAARATSCRRGLNLLVRQRPVNGRNGRVHVHGWQQRPHDFATADDTPLVGQAMPERQVELTVTPRPGLPAGAGTACDVRDVTILLLRLDDTPWATLEIDTPPTATIRLALEDAAGTGADGTGTATLLEWRHLPAPNGSHAWDTYPSIVRSAVTWVATTAANQPGVVLLAATMPQEVGVGIGVLAGRADTPWPATGLWPVQWEPSGRLVIPGLGLGSDSLRRVGD